MAVRESDYVVLAKLKATYDLGKDPEALREFIFSKYFVEKEKLIRLKEMYGFTPNTHNQLYDKHTIKKDRGCGCVLCIAIHKYAYANIRMQRFKKSYRANSIYDEALHIQNQFGAAYVGDNFYAQYSCHTEYQSRPENDLGENILTEEKFFKKEMEERKEHIKLLKAEYEAIGNAIQSILNP